MTQRRVENIRVHFWTLSPAGAPGSVKFSKLFDLKKEISGYLRGNYLTFKNVQYRYLKGFSLASRYKNDAKWAIN